MTPRGAPEAVLVALAEADLKLADAVDGKEGVPPALYERLFKERCDALAAYRAAVAPLRTRAMVDAEIAIIIRDWGGGSNGPFGAERFNSLLRLCSEPTADETEPEPNKPLRTVSEIIRAWQRVDPDLHGGTLRELVEALDREETEPNATTDHGADLREAEDEWCRSCPHCAAREE